MRKFRTRRRRAGFALVASLIVLVAGAGVFARLNAPDVTLASSETRSEAAVQRVESPNVDKAPQPARETGTNDSGTKNADAKSSDARASDTKTSDTKDAGTKGSRDQEGSSGGGDGGKSKGKQDDGGGGQAAAQPEIPKPATNDLWMDIPALGLDDNYIANSDSVAALDAGAAKLTSTGFPWQDNANTYISAHRLGWPGTASDHQFYNLPSLALGDKIYLYDENLTVYTYEVTGFVEVSPSDTWVTAPKAGRDMISLMTCIENFGDYWTMGPNWYARYVVQADRVSVDPA